MVWQEVIRCGCPKLQQTVLSDSRCERLSRRDILDRDSGHCSTMSTIDAPQLEGGILLARTAPEADCAVRSSRGAARAILRDGLDA
jgi:hypothetical protein